MAADAIRTPERAPQRPTEEQRRRQHEYYETRERHARLREAGFLVGSVRDFLLLSEAEERAVEEWASGFPLALHREFIWRTAARQAVERLPADKRLEAGKLLRSLQQGDSFHIQRRDLNRSGLYAYEWRALTAPEVAEPLLFIGVAGLEFLLLDICTHVDGESINTWLRARRDFNNMGRSYASLRGVAARLASDIERIFAMPYGPKRLPPLELTTTSRAKRAPFKLDILPSLRSHLRPKVIEAWKRVRARVKHAQTTGRKSKLTDESMLVKRLGRSERNRIVNEFMEDFYGLKGAAHMLTVEKDRAQGLRARAEAAADLLGEKIALRTLTTIKFNRRDHLPGESMEYPAIVFLDEVWRVAKGRGRAYLPVVAVGGSRKGNKALLYADLILAVGGYRRDEASGETAHLLAPIEPTRPTEPGEIIAAVRGAAGGSSYQQCRKHLLDLVKLQILRVEKVGKRIRYTLGDGPHAPRSERSGKSNKALPVKAEELEPQQAADSPRSTVTATETIVRHASEHEQKRKTSSGARSFLRPPGVGAPGNKQLLKI